MHRVVDIINVLSVTTDAKVNHWIESNDDDTQDALYWRQAYDIRSSELSVRCPSGVMLGLHANPLNYRLCN